MLNCPSPVGEIEVMKADCPFYKLPMLFYARILPGALEKNVKSEKNRQEKKSLLVPINTRNNLFISFYTSSRVGGFLHHCVVQLLLVPAHHGFYRT